MSAKLFTIGHSTHSLDEFVALLTQHGIQTLVDIRRFPGSRKFPHFNQENLKLTLPERSIEYVWLEVLGGRRKKAAGTSDNLGLRNESFRNYADYMSTPDFQRGVQQLLDIAAEKPTCYMCSESMFWSCHRRLVSDYLLTRGVSVQHIMPSGELMPHKLTHGAIITDGKLTYPAPEDDQRQFAFD
jgi:uncharacterized protein (DUF488 family)